MMFNSIAHFHQVEINLKQKIVDYLWQYRMRNIGENISDNSFQTTRPNRIKCRNKILTAAQEILNTVRTFSYASSRYVFDF